MKKICALCMTLFLFACAQTQLEAREQAIDEVLVTVYASDSDPEIILSSDIKPSLDGMPRSLRDIVLERLMILDATKFKISITEDDIERFIADLQKQNNMSRKDMEGLMDHFGYTFEEGKQALRRRNITEQIIDFRIKSDKDFLVTKDDVQKYYDEHPEYTKASYTLAQTFVPFSHMPQKEVERHIKKKTIATAVAWEEPFTIEEDQLAQEMKFVVNERVGAIVDKDVALDSEKGNGMELTRLVSKTNKEKVPFEERYDLILNQLRRERYMSLLNKYYDRLLEHASIRFTYPEDRARVFEA